MVEWNYFEHIAQIPAFRTIAFYQHILPLIYVLAAASTYAFGVALINRIEYEPRRRFWKICLTIAASLLLLPLYVAMCLFARAGSRAHMVLSGTFNTSFLVLLGFIYYVLFLSIQLTVLRFVTEERIRRRLGLMIHRRAIAFLLFPVAATLVFFLLAGVGAHQVRFAVENTLRTLLADARSEDSRETQSPATQSFDGLFNEASGLTIRTYDDVLRNFSIIENPKSEDVEYHDAIENRRRHVGMDILFSTENLSSTVPPAEALRRIPQTKFYENPAIIELGESNRKIVRLLERALDQPQTEFASITQYDPYDGLSDPHTYNLLVHSLFYEATIAAAHQDSERSSQAIALNLRLVRRLWLSDGEYGLSPWNVRSAAECASRSFQHSIHHVAFSNENLLKISNAFFQPMESEIDRFRRLSNLNNLMYTPWRRSNLPPPLDWIEAIYLEGSAFQNELAYYHFEQKYDLHDWWSPRFTIELALIKVSCALLRFRNDHGRYPNKLDELIPQYIARIPIDPHRDEKPFRYRQNVDGYPIVYSVGAKGITYIDGATTAPGAIIMILPKPDAAVFGPATQPQRSQLQAIRDDFH